MSKKVTIPKKKVTKKKVVEKSTIELESDELHLIIEALRKQEEKIREERFYRRSQPEGFYNIYLERYWRLLDKLDRRLPNPIYIKLPKF